MSIIIVFTTTSWPTEKKIENSWVYSLINATKEPNDYAYQIREAYEDITDRELIKRINAKYYANPEYKETLNTLNLRYQKDIQLLWREQFKTIGIALMAWVIPIVIVYLMGLAIGWIYKGFKIK